MPIKTLLVALSYLMVTLFSQSSHAAVKDTCQADSHPAISFIEFASFDLTPLLVNPDYPPTPVTVKGKLKLPVEWQVGKRCFVPKRNLAAVVILHGSAGVDFRGDFYASALNAAGIATLEIDMWDARGLTGLGDSRPPLPFSTYPDAFRALAFLATVPGINANRIGVLGFSWGGVISVASATENVVKGVSKPFAGGRRFKAHVANYPVCYAYNNPYIPMSEFGADKGNALTGAPLMIQIGSNDDYDRLDASGNGSLACLALEAGLTDSERAVVDVVPYEGAYHAWDRLMVPVSAEDPFAHFGLGGTVRIEPSVDQAYQSRDRVVRFFQTNLRKAD